MEKRQSRELLRVCQKRPLNTPKLPEKFALDFLTKEQWQCWQLFSIQRTSRPQEFGQIGPEGSRKHCPHGRLTQVKNTSNSCGPWGRGQIQLRCASSSSKTDQHPQHAPHSTPSITIKISPNGGHHLPYFLASGIHPTTALLVPCQGKRLAGLLAGWLAGGWLAGWLRLFG